MTAGLRAAVAATRSAPSAVAVHDLPPVAASDGLPACTDADLVKQLSAALDCPPDASPALLLQYWAHSVLQRVDAEFLARQADAQYTVIG